MTALFLPLTMNSSGFFITGECKTLSAERVHISVGLFCADSPAEELNFFSFLVDISVVHWKLIQQIISTLWKFAAPASLSTVRREYFWPSHPNLIHSFASLFRARRFWLHWEIPSFPLGSSEFPSSPKLLYWRVETANLMAEKPSV